MPVVPRPQNFSVMPSVGGGGGFSNPLSNDAATLPGRQISALGEAIQSGAQAADAFAKAAKDKAEATVALDGSNTLQQMRFDLADPDKVFPGVNDWSKTDHALSVFDQGWKDISEKMSPGAQAMLDQSAASIRKDLAGDLVRQDGERVRTFRSGVLNTRVNLATGALMAGSSDNDAAYAAQARAALLADGLGQGLSGEDLDKQTAFAFGRRVVEPVVTARLSQGDVAGAKAFFDAHRDGMAADDADILDKHLAEAGQAVDTRNAIDGLWDRLGPKNLNDPVDLNAIENDLVYRYAGDDQGLIRARDEVLHRILGHIEARDDYNAGNANAAIQLVKGGASPAQLAIQPQFLALPQDQQQQIADWHREQLTGKLTGLTPDQNLDRMIRQFAAYHDLTGDDALKQMSEARISALEPVLGGDLTKQAFAQKTATSLDTTSFAALAQGIGLNPNPDPSDLLGRAQLGVIRSAADRAIGASGRPLTPQQQREIGLGAAQTAIAGHPLLVTMTNVHLDPFGGTARPSFLDGIRRAVGEPRAEYAETAGTSLDVPVVYLSGVKPVRKGEAITQYGEKSGMAARIGAANTLLHQRFSKITSFPLEGGGYHLNIDDKRPPEGVATFGMVRNHGQRPHQGLDIQAPVGTPVVAAGDGKVVRSYYSKDYGFCIEIDHGDHLYSFYAHLEESGRIQDGMAVKAGERIARVGKSGNAKDPRIDSHLHFELRTLPYPHLGLKGRIDPMPYVYPLHWRYGANPDY